LVLIQAPDPAPVRIAFSEANEGSRFFPAFTDEAALLRFQPSGGETALIALSDLREALATAPIKTLVIDPGSSTQRVIQLDA
jgi:hypothetical protein